MIVIEQKVIDLLDKILYQLDKEFTDIEHETHINYIKSKLPQTSHECMFNEFTHETVENICDVLEFILTYGEYFDNTYIIDLLQLLQLEWRIEYKDGYYYGKMFDGKPAIPKGQTFMEALHKVVIEYKKFWRAIQC